MAQKLEEKEVLFVSRHKKLQLPYLPAIYEIDGGGVRRLRNGAKIIKFSGGAYKTSDKAEIAFIRSHRMFKNKKVIEGELPLTPAEIAAAKEIADDKTLQDAKKIREARAIRASKELQEEKVLAADAVLQEEKAKRG